MVRVVTLQNSVQLCGWTHVKNVGDIKKFAIKYIETKGANIYRIEATTDENIEEELFEVIKPYNDEMIKLLNKAKNIVDEAIKKDINVEFNIDIDNSKPTCYKDIIFNRNEVTMTREKVKTLEKEYNMLKSQKELSNSKELDDINKSNNIEYIVKKVNDYDTNILKQLIDNKFNEIKNGIIFIANIKGNNVNYICKSNCDLDAGLLIKEASSLSNGNGGGSKNFGQGGGTNIDKVDYILNNIIDRIGDLWDI